VNSTVDATTTATALSMTCQTVSSVDTIQQVLLQPLQLVTSNSVLHICSVAFELYTI